MRGWLQEVNKMSRILRRLSGRNVKAEEVAKLPPKEEEKKEDKKEDKKEAKRKKAAEKKGKLLREKEEKKRAKEEKKKRKKSKAQKIDGDDKVKAVPVDQPQPVRQVVIVEEEEVAVEEPVNQIPAAHNSGGHNNNIKHGPNLHHTTTNQAEQQVKIDIASNADDDSAEFQFSPPPPPQVRAPKFVFLVVLFFFVDGLMFIFVCLPARTGVPTGIQGQLRRAGAVLHQLLLLRRPVFGFLPPLWPRLERRHRRQLGVQVRYPQPHCLVTISSTLPHPQEMVSSCGRPPVSARPRHACGDELWRQQDRSAWPWAGRHHPVYGTTFIFLFIHLFVVCRYVDVEVVPLSTQDQRPRPFRTSWTASRTRSAPPPPNSTLSSAPPKERCNTTQIFILAAAIVR
jgi:hypothetical protein